ncbi:hypothetical protein EDD18DRAFT_1107477 [Armillaria luteobubalina]|uniref:Uncharacterized protein n=1 Tax=Armillaria luteobubalina TaxID=153913 RepID=A0AA39Q1B0_9AGAR|nr:hypothetical protein EDD18DRAFT_1107477 [Armillaria luteobubalina]
MITDRVHRVRQVEIKMKSHGVGICGLVEEIEIRLEGQVEILGVINEYVKLKPGNGIQRNPIMSWGQLDELKVEGCGVCGMLVTHTAVMKFCLPGDLTLSWRAVNCLFSMCQFMPYIV